MILTASAVRPRVSSDHVLLPLPQVALASVASAVDGALTRGDGMVVDAAFDSREVVPGCLFFCIPGSRADGHDFAPQALARGAAAFVVERWLDLNVPQVLVPSVRAAMGPMAAVVFGRPAESLTMMGVTGTNGKTTVTYLLESILLAAGAVPGIIGTTGLRIDGEPGELERTTPEAPDLQRLLARMSLAGVSAVAMEVSSHALTYRRVDGMTFDVASFLNMSHDHLDLHGSMEAYFEAKARLFTPALAHAGVVNVDDPWGRRLADGAGIPVTTFGEAEGADLHANDVEVTPDAVSFTAGGTRVAAQLFGAFNVSNCLCALAMAVAAGIDIQVAARGLSAASAVPGRGERVDGGGDFAVVVDYAHTPDSIRSVLRSVRPLASGRIIVVFGCGGDRDRDKRPHMGRAATESADLTYLTSDNPRSEEPSAIIAEVEPGARAGGGEYVIEPDRRAAIRAAIRSAEAGDVVVIAGKGHEVTQEAGGVLVPFDDRNVAREELASVGGRA